MIDQCRTPRWVRGLKLNVGNPNVLAMASHPTMGAWIEIINVVKNKLKKFVAPHDGCVD